MKDIKTTLAGAFTAIVVAIQGAHGHDWKTILVAVGIALVGYFASDSK